VVRLKRAGHVFEVVTNPGAVTAWRSTPDSTPTLSALCVSPVIFSNQSKGLRAPCDHLISAFETNDLEPCLKAIFEKGELQVSASERQEKNDQCRRAILQTLHKGYIDPRTNLPHPLVRIDAAISGIKGWRADPEKPIPIQVQEVVKKLHGILSLVKSEIGATLVIPGAYAGAASSIVHKLCNVAGESYAPDRAVTYAITIAPGDLDPFMAALNKVTKGDFQMKMDKAAAAAEPAPSAKGGKKKRNK